MKSEQIMIQTSVTGRQIRQAMNALLKAQAIVSGYKIPHVKYFKIDENKKTVTINIQLLVLELWPKRESAWHKILDQIVKSRTVSELKL